MICYNIEVVNRRHNAGMAQSVEHVIGNDEVISSILITSSKIPNASHSGFLLFYSSIRLKQAKRMRFRGIMMSTRGDHAKELFLQGYTCAQAVVLAFEDVTGLERTVAAKLSSGFGGGMGRLREVCGAVSGMFMVYDLVCGYSEPGNMESKKRVYADIRELADRFKAQSGGSIICRELLAGVETTAGKDPEQRTPEYYAKRPCPQLVALAADVLDEFLREKQVI